MAAPLIAAGAAATAVSGIGQVIVGLKKAREQGKIDQATYDRLVAAYQKLEEAYQLPSGYAQPFTPEEIQLIGTYTPEIASYVRENRPDIITESQSGAAKTAQNEALSRYRSLAMTGDDAISRAARENAQFEAQQNLNAMRAQILRDRAARGTLGSGDEMLAQLQAADQANISARQNSLQAAAQAQQRRMQALAAQASLAGNIRGQNLNVEQANVNIMNDFNRRQAANQNVYNRYVADTRNRAQQYDLGERQRVADTNVDLRNRTALDNLRRQEAATESRRVASNRLAELGFEKERELGGLQNQMATNKLAAKYMPWQVGLGTLGNLGTAAFSSGVSGAMQNQAPATTQGNTVNTTNTAQPSSTAWQGLEYEGDLYEVPSTVPRGYRGPL